MAEYIWSAPSDYANDVSELKMDHIIWSISYGPYQKLRSDLTMNLHFEKCFSGPSMALYNQVYK